MGCFLGSVKEEWLPKVEEMGFKELQHPPGMGSSPKWTFAKGRAGLPFPSRSPSSQPCCLCPPRGAREEQKAGVPLRHKETKQTPTWAEMDHFASVERSIHISLPVSLRLAGHHHFWRYPECHSASPVAPSQRSASRSHGKV